LKQPKPKRCKVCKNEFIPKSSTAIVCSFSCALEYTEQQRVKKEAKLAKQTRQERTEAIKKLRPRGWYVKECQKVVNAFIRERDKDELCISCGKDRNGYDAGHYLSRSIRPELRFNEDNIHKQCKYCNNYDKGTVAAGYRDGIIAKIGLERVLALEAPHEPAKWTIPELEAIKKEYKAKLKALREI
jgi:hypothetical protein